ncbi:Lrp/AsnC family transcriptional regulator [Luteithermobacter gelatinilyticus]|uniref:Lrp/AsnC family transcriptional regulator n=1 Tax=Luteithermobacter gelatinilyticus TaxID=2582913 RepID=UPI0011058024|nr:Lrp/AsnC family transcriptional regulator [Luteithermobacter gelatinilyticus]|tara:strand:+ start:15208 stop:15684 length:477 start_codon:yes stop_codon:yes gene_type:complete
MLDKLSDIDKKILAALQEDNSLTNTELADKVGLSTAPCWRRIRKLEEMGLIDKRVALLNAEKLGLNIVSFANVKLSHHRDNALEDFERLIKVYPEVTECYTISGSMDYVLKIITTDMTAYENFLRHKLLKMDMVNEVHSRFAVTKVKYTTALPLKLSS